MRRQGTSRLRLGLFLIGLASACGDPAPPPGQPATPPPGPVATPLPTATPVAADGGAAPGAAPGAAAPVAAPAPVKKDKPSPCLTLTGRDRVLCDARERPFKPEDLTASPPANTDPFHNNLSLFATSTGPKTPTGGSQIPQGPPCLLAKYNLEDLKLAAIILSPSDGTLSRAMFIDPATIGQTVKRGDCIGKARARIARITPDKVIFEFTEDLGGGKTKLSSRAIELHPAEAGK